MTTEVVQPMDDKQDGIAALQQELALMNNQDVHRAEWKEFLTSIRNVFYRA